MEGSSSNITLTAEKASTEVLEDLQKDYLEKESRIRELKRQIESTKLCLEKKKKEIPEEKMEAFKTLSEKYTLKREEHNALLAEEFGKSNK